VLYKHPASYVVTAADMHSRYSDNDIIKFADDTYLIIPADYLRRCSVHVYETTDDADNDCVHSCAADHS